MRSSILVFSCTVLSTIYAGCGGGSSSPPPPPPPPPQPVGTLAPSSLSFGSISVSTTSPAQALTLTNNSTPVLTINTITATGPFSQTNNCPASLSSNAFCTINVTFGPTTTGTSTGSITVVDNASNSPQTASLSGTGIAPPVTLSPASLTFGDTVVGNSSGVQLLNLTNNLGTSLTITSITATGPFSQTNNCPPSLSSNAFCLIYVTFSPSALGSSSGSITFVDNASNNPQTANLSGTGTPGFAGTGSMGVSLSLHTATLLNSGEVLAAGDGWGEVYNSATGSFAAPVNMTVARQYHAATLLNNEKVLITGGYDPFSLSWLASAELYDLATGTFTAAGSMTTPRAYHTSTILRNGEVLITGGYDFAALASAELYNPATATFTATGTMSVVRHAQMAAALNDGTVLIAGGHDTNNAPIASAEIYDPLTGSFTATTGNMNNGFDAQTATLLNNGRVLITGVPGTTFLANAQIYDPTTKTFSDTTGSMATARQYDTATLLNNGQVLIAGGLSSSAPAIVASAELYDPLTVTFSTAGSMTIGRYAHTATLLNNGKVLVAGGIATLSGIGGPTGSAELYLPGTLTPTGLVSIAVAPSAPVLAQPEMER